jgi:hypothetical protein
MTEDALRACAEIIAGAFLFNNVPAICNVARCGLSTCGYVRRTDGVYAGMLPLRLKNGYITAALTALPGSPADPRQAYDTAYDNPSMVLHIVGDDLVDMDSIADNILRLDRSAHITTQWGTVNGLRVNPAKRTVRNDRPRYDLQMTIEMEMIRT